MAGEKPTYIKLDINKFQKNEIVVDSVGNVFLKRTTVAKIMGCSLPVLATTFKRKGLRPMDRYINGFKAYFIEDVEKAYNRREEY